MSALLFFFKYLVLLVGGLFSVVLALLLIYSFYHFLFLSFLVYSFTRFFLVKKMEMGPPMMLLDSLEEKPLKIHNQPPKAYTNKNKDKTQKTRKSFNQERLGLLWTSFCWACWKTFASR